MFHRSIAALCAALFVTFFVSEADAKYFFSVNDVLATPCTYTPMDSTREMKAVLQKSYGPGTDCTVTADDASATIITCRARMTNMIYITDTKGSCDSIRGNVMQMLGN